MSGYKIKFNGIDRLYNKYSWRLTKRAKAVWKTGNVVSTKHTEDSYLDQLEKSVAKYTKRKFGIAVGSGTDALYFALRAKGIGPGKTVVCPAISYMATAEAIKRTGARIYFVDVNENGLIGDVGIKTQPDAVVYVNLFGNLADYDRLTEYCEENKIPLIEDAAQSLGSFYKKIPSGKLGDISSLSFAPSKPLPCLGNGGMVLTDNENETDLIRSMRYHGAGTAKLHHGYNSCLSNDHANVLNFLLSKYKKLLNNTSKVRQLYEDILSKQGVTFIKTQNGTISNNHKFVIKTHERDKLKEYLSTKGIETQIHYTTPMSKMKMFYTDDKMPNAERFSADVLSLPIHPYLEDYEVSYVCKCIGDFYGV